MEHKELVKEMERLGSMSVWERVKLAKKRRHGQLQNYKKWAGEGKAVHVQGHITNKVKFSPEVQLIDAVLMGDIESLKNILDAGVNVNTRDYQGMTPLHQCCVEGHLEMTELLLQSGAEINATDVDGWTPLHIAATCDHKDIVALLIRSGANLLACNNDGDMPFHITDDKELLGFLNREMTYHGITEQMVAEKRCIKHTIMERDIQKIIRDGGDLNCPVTNDGASFLHVAIANFYQDLVKLLLKNGASDQVEDEDGWRPIHVAAYWNNERAFKRLISQGNFDNIKAKTLTGETPYDLCTDRNMKTYITWLLKEHTRDSLDLTDDCDVFDSGPDVHDSSQNYMVKRAKLRRASIEDILILKPLLNPGASERSSEKKSSFKETKKQAPNIKSNTTEVGKELLLDKEIENLSDANNVNITQYVSNESQLQKVSSIQQVSTVDKNNDKRVCEYKQMTEKDFHSSAEQLGGTSKHKPILSYTPNHKIQNQDTSQNSMLSTLDSNFPVHSLPYLKRERLQERQKKVNYSNNFGDSDIGLSNQFPLPSPTMVRHIFKETIPVQGPPVIHKTKRYHIKFCNCLK